MKRKTGKVLLLSQAEAARLMLNAKLAVITGGSGTGKTSTLDTPLRILIGRRKAIGIAVRGGNQQPRWTKLGASLSRGDYQSQ